MDIKHAIFDLDGTILDSMQAWGEVTSELLRGFGFNPKPGLKEALRPLGGHQIPEYFKTRYGIDAPLESIAASLGGLLERYYFEEAALKDGVLDTLEALKRTGCKMCVATATDRYLVEPALKRLGVLDFFGRIFTCGEEKAGKDRPDIFLSAASFLGSAPCDTWVFEDSLHAVKTAKNAGFYVAAVYDEYADDQQDEIRAVADMYLRSFRDFARG